MFKGMNPLQIFLLSGAIYSVAAIALWLLIDLIKDNKRQILDYMARKGERIEELFSDEEEFDAEWMDSEKWRRTR